MKLTGKSKRCCCPFYLIPNSKSLAKECEFASYNFKAEKLLGESIENLSKVCTMITTSTTISNVHHLYA